MLTPYTVCIQVILTPEEVEEFKNEFLEKSSWKL